MRLPGNYNQTIVTGHRSVTSTVSAGGGNSLPWSSWIRTEHMRRKLAQRFDILTSL